MVSGIENQAKNKIYSVEYENQADLKISFVGYENQAGWRQQEEDAFDVLISSGIISL